MRLFALTAILAFCSSVLQTSVLPFFQLGLLRLEGFCALLAWVGCMRPFWPWPAISALAAAMVAGFSTVIPFQLTVLALMAGASLAAYISLNVMEISFLHKVLTTGLVSLLVHSVIMAGSGNVDLVWPWAFAQTAVNLASAPLLLAIMDALAALFRVTTAERDEDEGQEAF